MEIEISKDKELLRTPQYHKILDMIDELKKMGFLERFSRNCVAACEIVQNMLESAGIPSKIIECQLFIKYGAKDTQVMFIGYDNATFQGEVDTHVVIVTETEVPILIDLSIAHVMPESHPFIIEKLNGIKEGVLADYHIDNITLTYSEKKKIRLVKYHQKNLLARIAEDQKTQNTISNLKTLVLICIVLGLTNFIANSLMIALKIIFP